MPSLWDAPPDRVAHQLQDLADRLAADDSAHVREALVAAGAGDLLHLVPEARHRFEAAWLARDEADDRLRAVRAKGRELVAAAWEWVEVLRGRLARAEHDHPRAVRALRARLGLDRLKGPRHRALLDALRVVLPELRDADLPDDAPPVEAAFLADGHRHLAALNAHERRLEEAAREAAETVTALQSARRNGRGMYERLRTELRALELERGLDVSGFDLRILRAYRSGRGAA